MHVLNALPVDVTYIDAEDRVRYFSENAHKVFVRPRAVLGRTVQHCHPPQSVDRVEKILSAFKEGSRDSAEFWLNFKGRFAFCSAGSYLQYDDFCKPKTGRRAAWVER